MFVYHVVGRCANEVHAKHLTLGKCTSWQTPPTRELSHYHDWLPHTCQTLYTSAWNITQQLCREWRDRASKIFKRALTTSTTSLYYFAWWTGKNTSNRKFAWLLFGLLSSFWYCTKEISCIKTPCTQNSLDHKKGKICKYSYELHIQSISNMSKDVHSLLHSTLARYHILS